MKVGIEEEEDQRVLEKRRTFARFGIKTGRRRFQLPIASEELELSGMVDVLLELGERSFEEAVAQGTSTGEIEFIPVEWKASGKPIQRHQLLQIAGYAMMIEEAVGTSVPFGFFVSLPSERVKKVEIGKALRAQVLEVHRQVMAGLGGEEMPAPTPHRGKCASCEFRRFCNDVW
jgi:CRISPR-associated exonuclease Cas4